MATGTLNGMGRMNGPIMPETKAIGMKARITAIVATLVGLPISLVAITSVSLKGRLVP